MYNLRDYEGAYFWVRILSGTMNNSSLTRAGDLLKLLRYWRGRRPELWDGTKRWRGVARDRSWLMRWTWWWIVRTWPWLARYLSSNWWRHGSSWVDYGYRISYRLWCGIHLTWVLSLAMNVMWENRVLNTSTMLLLSSCRVNNIAVPGYTYTWQVVTGKYPGIWWGHLELLHMWCGRC